MKDLKQYEDDFRLVRAFQAGDEKAFEELIRKYQRQVANIIYLSLGDREIVQDLVQEVFIRVFKSVRHFEFDSSFYSWLYRITVNLCIDEIRRRKFKRTFSLGFLSNEQVDEKLASFEKSHTPSDLLLEGEKKETVLKALQKLNVHHRAVMILREYDGLSYEEIAKTLTISIQAVKSRIFRAREEMRKLLKEYFKERL